MSISVFRKNKLNYVFNVFFDVNQSGEIDRKDFEIAVKKICDLRGWLPGSEKNAETHEVMIKIWEGLRSKADKDNDGQVSIEEWCNMWDAYAQDPSNALEWQQRYMNFMFDLEDASNDGTIDSNEFSIVCSSYGIDKTECERAFSKMSQGAVEVTREDFAVLWQQFWQSDEPSSPGNFIFGKTSY